MLLTLDIADALTARLPSLSVAAIRTRGGPKFPVARQRALIHLMETSYARRQRHSLDRSADTFSRGYLRDTLRTKDRWGDLMTPLYEFPKENSGYSKDGGITKAYRLRPEVWAAMDAVMQGDTAAVALVDWQDGSDPVQFDTLPDDGMPEGLRGELHVPKVLPLDLATISRAMAWVDERTALEGGTALLDRRKGSDSLTLDDARRILVTCRRWTLAVGGLPNVYQPATSGRLGGVGPVHVVSLPRMLRQRVLAGSGLVDYDIRAAYWSLVQSVARGCLGIDTPTIDAYVDHREAWHRRWTTVTGVANTADLKQLAVSWLTGGVLSDHWTTAAAQTIGERAVAALMGDRETRALYDEARTVARQVAKVTLTPEMDGNRTVYRNVLGEPLPPPEGCQKATEAQRHTHALQGLEQLAIRCMVRHAEGVAALVYDGFIATPQPTGRLEALVREESQRKLGYPLTLSLKVESFEED